MQKAICILGNKGESYIPEYQAITKATRSVENGSDLLYQLKTTFDPVEDGSDLSDPAD